MHKRICIVTTNHISTNPRLVKEAVALSEAGYDVHVVFTQHTGYLANEDALIMLDHPKITFYFRNWVGDNPISQFQRLRSGLSQKLARILFKALGIELFSKLLLNRHYSFQLGSAISIKAGIYIAHNAGALPVVADAARHTGAQFAFDAEVYHRGEQLPAEVCEAIVRNETRYLPCARYISASSPLIRERYTKLFPEIEILEIRNVFPIRTVPEPKLKEGPLTLLWFSQTVGLNRGLQDVLCALKHLEGHSITLHIYGFLPPDVRSTFEALMTKIDLKDRNRVRFFDPVSPEVLLQLAPRYDIGLATEPGFCENNEIALSNKIFTYLSAGNAIIFSNTPAQAKFYNDHRGLGFLFQTGVDRQLAFLIKQYYDDRTLLLHHRQCSRQTFLSNANWESEQKRLLFLLQMCFADRKIVQCSKQMV